MPTVRFTQNIQRHLACPTLEVTGATVRGVLEAYFQVHERARSYVLDDQGHLADLRGALREARLAIF